MKMQTEPPKSGDEWKRYVNAKLAAFNLNVDECTLIVRPAPFSCGGPEIQVAYVTGKDNDGVPFVMVL